MGRACIYFHARPCMHGVGARTCCPADCMAWLSVCLGPGHILVHVVLQWQESPSGSWWLPTGHDAQMGWHSVHLPSSARKRAKKSYIVYREAICLGQLYKISTTECQNPDTVTLYTVCVCVHVTWRFSWLIRYQWYHRQHGPYLKFKNKLHLGYSIQDYTGLASNILSRFHVRRNSKGIVKSKPSNAQYSRWNLTLKLYTLFRFVHWFTSRTCCVSRLNSCCKIGDFIWWMCNDYDNYYDVIRPKARKSRQKHKIVSNYHNPGYWGAMERDVVQQFNANVYGWSASGTFRVFSKIPKCIITP